MQNLWNTIDLGFIAVFTIYLVLRIFDITHRHTKVYFAQALDVLACGAIMLFPRLAFLLLSRSSLVLGLRAMTKKFVSLLALAAWCFVGFGLAFYLLGGGAYSPAKIAKVGFLLYLVLTSVADGTCTAVHDLGEIAVRFKTCRFLLTIGHQSMYGLNGSAVSYICCTSSIDPLY